MVIRQQMYKTGLADTEPSTLKRLREIVVECRKLIWIRWVTKILLLGFKSNEIQQNTFLFIFDLHTLNFFCLNIIFYSNISYFDYETKATVSQYMVCISIQITDLYRFIIPTTEHKNSHDCK